MGEDVVSVVMLGEDVVSDVSVENRTGIVTTSKI